MDEEPLPAAAGPAAAAVGQGVGVVHGNEEQLSDIASTAAASAPAAATAATSTAAAADEELLLDTQGYSRQVREKGEAAKARCIKVLRGFHPSFLAVVEDTPGEVVVEHGLFVRPAAKMNAEAYGQGRVVVVGDAAHALRPTGKAGRGVGVGGGGRG